MQIKYVKMSNGVMWFILRLHGGGGEGGGAERPALASVEGTVPERGGNIIMKNQLH